MDKYPQVFAKTFKTCKMLGMFHNDLWVKFRHGEN